MPWAPTRRCVHRDHRSLDRELRDNGERHAAAVDDWKAGSDRCRLDGIAVVSFKPRILVVERKAAAADAEVSAGRRQRASDVAVVAIGVVPAHRPASGVGDATRTMLARSDRKPGAAISRNIADANRNAPAIRVSRHRLPRIFALLLESSFPKTPPASRIAEAGQGRSRRSRVRGTPARPLRRRARMRHRLYLLSSQL